MTCRNCSRSSDRGALGPAPGGAFFISKKRARHRPIHYISHFEIVIDKRVGLVDYQGMGKEVENSQRSTTPLEPRDTPNRKTSEAMAAAERGEVEHCKDVDDLLAKLKS
jgi:hypothetical protein